MFTFFSEESRAIRKAARIRNRLRKQHCRRPNDLTRAAYFAAARVGDDLVADVVGALADATDQDASEAVRKHAKQSLADLAVAHAAQALAEVQQAADEVRQLRQEIDGRVTAVDRSGGNAAGQLLRLTPEQLEHAMQQPEVRSYIDRLDVAACDDLRTQVLTAAIRMAHAMSGTRVSAPRSPDEACQGLRRVSGRTGRALRDVAVALRDLDYDRLAATRRLEVYAATRVTSPPGRSSHASALADAAERAAAVTAGWQELNQEHRRAVAELHANHG